MVTEVPKESTMELESDWINYENSQNSANENHWVYFTTATKSLVISILRRTYQCYAIDFEKQVWENRESFDRTFLFNLLKRFNPKACGKSTDITTITNRFLQLEYNNDVFKGEIDTFKLVQQIYAMQNTYKNEVDSLDIAFVKNWIDNMITEYRITNGLEARVETKKLKSTYDCCNASEHQALPKSQ